MGRAAVREMFFRSLALCPFYRALHQQVLRKDEKFSIWVILAILAEESSEILIRTTPSSPFSSKLTELLDPQLV